jgi:diacylglycerol kinase family enzyme
MTRNAMDATAPVAPPLFIVANAGSGTASDEVLERVAVRLHAAGRRFKILKATRSDDVPRLAARAALLARRHDGALIAAGGDGTLNAVAREAIRTGIAVGVLPLGTFNYFAREHGLPADPDEAVDIWLAGHVEPAQIGQVNGLPFLVNASLGMYPEVLKAREADCKRLGRNRFVAVLSGLKTLLSWRGVMRIVTATERTLRHFRTPTLFIGNNALQLARLGFDEATQIGRGNLAAIRVAPLSPWRVLSIVARAVVGRVAPAQEVTSEPFRRMTVAPADHQDRSSHVEVACDGELRALRAPLHFRVLPSALRLIKRSP